MSIAYLISEYPARSHTFIRRELAAMKEKGIDIDVFAIRRPDPSSLLSDLEREDYKNTWSILPPKLPALISSHWQALKASPGRYFKTLRSALKHRHPGTKNALWSFFYFVEAIHLCSELKRRNTRHLHVHFANAGAYIGRLCHDYLGITWSMTLHGACDFEFPAGPLLGEKLETASFANCASYYGRSQSYRVLDPADWQKVFVSRCGIEYDRLPEIKNQPPFDAKDAAISGEPLRIYCVGRISSEKGHLGLLEALRIVIDSGMKAELTLIGDGPDRPRLEQRIQALKLDNAVHLLGSKSEHDVLDLVRDAHVFALPSFMEGVPLVLMEAMGLNVPVVAPRVAGIPELVEDGQTGLLYHPGDWNDMARCILQLAKDPALADRLRQAARLKVAEEFNIRTAIDPLVEAFNASK